MSIYTALVSQTPLTKQTQACFTGRHALYFGGALFIGGIFGGAALGAIIGALIGLVVTPGEGVSRTVAAAVLAKLGAKIGAFLGGLITAVVMIAGRCRCPGANTGFCICIMWFRTSPTSMWFPIALWPCPSACRTLVPPGCP